MAQIGLSRTNQRVNIQSHFQKIEKSKYKESNKITDNIYIDLSV